MLKLGLVLVPAGHIKSFDLRGDLLNDIPDGAHIRVKGKVHSFLHTGGTKEDPSQFPPQWIVYLEVTELELQTDAVTLRKLRAEQGKRGH